MATYKAVGDLSGKEGYFVKMSADGAVEICSALTDIPVGAVHEGNTEGRAVSVAESGKEFIKVGAVAVTAGMLVGTDATGTAVEVDPDGAVDYYYKGQVVVGAAPGEFAEVKLFDAPVIQSES